MGTITHTIKVNADVNQAKATLQDLQAQLQSLASVPVGVDATGLQSAKASILELGQSLRTAMNPNTGKLDLSVFSRELKASNKTILDYKNALFSMGTQGQQAFLTLANTIASAEAPTNRLNQKVLQFGKTLKNTINWQLSSSLIHGVIGQVQKAINYAEKLNTSLNNIQIVTGQNNEKMAEFAKQANQTAKQLSTTTTEYTNASLIYYQQGLSDKEVAKRTETTLKLANVTRQSAQTVSDQMTAIWNNYAEGSDNLEHYADVITALGAATAASSAEIAGGLEKFAAVSKTVGLSYNYATTALATIVATTRQSEDTVGTGLRTIFSRLESLKLGETLEDGVGLTKYSAALKTAGVEVLDQYGAVKDMDKILDELGAKWKTISREQQIALAQTVGGVRQYTNLMALMNNWDKFQKNLKVAEGADGTLQTQEERYATSWEAARKRVQTSAEGIYDSLIDDQAIIKVTNVFAGFLDVVNGLVDGFGGLKVIIPTVLALLANSAAKNMPQFLNDIGNNMRVLFNRSQKDMTNMQGTLGDTLIHLRNNTTDEVYQAQLNKIIDTNTMNRSLALNANRMSDADKAAYQFKIAQREMENDARIMAAQEKQKNEQQYKQLLENQKSNTVKELSKYAEAKSQRGTLTSSRNTRQDTFKEAEHQRRVAQGKLDQRRGTAEYQALSQEIKLRQDMLRDSSLTAQHRNEITRELRNLQKAQHDYTAQEELAVKEANKNLTAAKSSYEDAKNKYDANEAIITKGEEQGTLANQLLAKNGVDVKALLKQYDIKDAGKLSKQMITEETLRQYRSGGILASNDKEFLTRINEGYYKGLRENQYARGFLNAGSAKINAFAQESKDLFNPDTKKIDQQAFTKKANEFAESWQNAVNNSDLNNKIKQSLQIDPAMLMPDQKAFDGSIDQFSQMLETKLSTLRMNISKNLKNLGIEETEINDILTKLGLSPNIEGIAQNAQEGGAAAFLRGYMLPKRDKSEEAKPTQAISTSLTQVASAAMTLYTAFQSASNAVQAFSDDTQDGLSRFGTVLSTVTSGLMSAGIAGNAIKGLGAGATTGFAGVLTTAGPWVGIALAIGSILLGWFNGRKKVEEETIKKETQDIYDKADESYERLTQSAELNKSQENLINAYNQTAEDLKRGQATQKELEEAKKALIESLNSSTESGYNNSNAIGAALAGNTAEVQHLIDTNRKRELELERQDAKDALDRAQSNVKLTQNRNGLFYSNEFSTYYINRGTSESSNEKSTTEILKSYPNSFNKLGLMTNGAYDYIKINDNFKSIDDFVNYYEDLKTLKELIKTLDLTENNDIYTYITGQMAQLAPALETYIKYSKQIKESDLEYLMLGGITDKGSVNIGQESAIAANEFIKDIKSYEEYRNALIELMTQGLTEGTKEYNEEISKIDAALGVLPSVTNYEQGNLQYISKGINSVVQNQLKYQSKDYDLEDEDFIRNSVQKLYERYQDAVFDWNYTIQIPLGFDFDQLENIDDPLFQAQIKAIEAKAKANKIKIAIDATAEFNLDVNSAYAEIAAFVKKMNASLDTNDKDAAGAWETYSTSHTKLTAADFFALPKEQREALVREVNRNATEAYYGANGAFGQEVASAAILSAQLNQSAATASQIYNEKYAGKVNGAYSESDILKRASLLNQYLSPDVDQTTKDNILAQLTSSKSTKADQAMASDLKAGKIDFIQGLLQQKDLLKETSLAAENQAVKVQELNAEWEAYGATAFRNQLLKQAEAWGINYDEVQQYATQLRELRFFEKDINTEEYQEQLSLLEGSLEDIEVAYANGSITEEQYVQRQQELTQELLQLNDAYNADIRASEEFALIQLRLEKGIETLSSNWSTWKKALKDTDKYTWSQLSAFKALQKTLGNILNQDPEKISEDFVDVAKSLGLIDEAAKGTKEGTEALQKFAFEAAVLEKDHDLYQYENLTDFHNAFSETLGNLSDDFEQFAEKVKDTDVGMPIIDTGNFIGAFTQVQIAAGQSLDSIKAMFANFGVALDAKWVPVDVPPATLATYENIASEITTNPDGSTASVTYYKNGNETLKQEGGTVYALKIGNATKTGAGGGGGKGGGGGGKKEPHKPKRYRNIENQIQNNKRKTDAASRDKDRAVGTAKLEYLEKERELREENLKLEQQYQKEIEDWLDKDRDKMMEAFAAINFTPIFDEAGEVINNDAFELAFEAIGDGSDEAWKKAEEALAQYEETLDKLNDKLEEIQELKNAIFDMKLERIKMEIDLNIDVTADRLEYLDYLINKLDDDAYQAAASIALLGEKTGETMEQAAQYAAGLEAILNNHTLADGTKLTLANIGTLTADQLKEAGFTQAEIDQIKEWRSQLLQANESLLEMRKTITDKLISTFEDLNEKVQRSYELFDHYNTTLEHYKNITDLIAKGNSSFQSRTALEALNRSSFTNSVNQLTAAKRILDDMPRYLAEAEQQYQDALASGDRDRIVNAERYLQTIQDREQEAREQWEEAWESSLESAQSFFEFTMDNIATDYEDTISGMFGTLDYLQEAYNKHKEDAEWYLESYDSLWKLGTLSREISKAIDDTDSIRIRQRYRDLQAQINKLQQEGTKLTEHQVEMLQREFELEQARAALEEAKNAKTQVRLQRDSEGRWGYVYTANNDAIDDAMNKYAEALHAFQETNHNEFKKLQDDFMGLLNFGTEIVEIMSNMDVSADEAEAIVRDRMDLILGDDGQLQHLLDQLTQANTDEEKIREMFAEIYGENALNSWLTFDDTLLKQFFNVDTVDELRTLLEEEYMKAFKAGKDARLQLATDVGTVGDAAGVSVEDFGGHVHDLVQHLDAESLAAIQSVDDLATAMNTTFTQAMQQALQWEKDYADQMAKVIAQNEAFVTSIDEMLEALNEMDGIEFYTRINGIAGAAGQKQMDLDEIASGASGMYTGTWGPYGKLAVLHEKEQVFNKDDTARILDAAQLLRTIDLQTGLFGQGLGKLMLPTLSQLTSQTLDQNVTITASFPNATNHSEIEEAFTNLINKASQYANRKGY